MSESTLVNHRYDFVYLFDCKDGNPNGDPDFANTPRFDPETFQGLVSDVCLKRKVRNYVRAAKGSDGKVEPGYGIFVEEHHSLESRQRLPYDQLKLDPKKKDGSMVEKARRFMCENFFDVRAFGAVMSTTDFNCGQVRGPVQITFARSVDRVFTAEHAVTRVAYTTEAKQSELAAKGATTEMGGKHTVAYGLYQSYGFVNPIFARDTRFNEDDLSLLWKALSGMFDLDRSAARGLMSCRGLYAFKHSSPLGDAQAHRLFDRVSVNRRTGVEAPRNFTDYEVVINANDLPKGVELMKIVG